MPVKIIRNIGTLQDLEAEINAAMRQGFAPSGQPIYQQASLMWAQLMVKPEVTKIDAVELREPVPLNPTRRK